MPELKFLKRWFFLGLFKSYKIELILAFSLTEISFVSPFLRKWRLLLVLNLIK